MTSLADDILALLCAIAPDVDARTVDRGKPLPDQLDLDSMDYQNLLAAIAKQFRIEIAAADVPRLQSIDDLSRYVAART